MERLTKHQIIDYVAGYYKLSNRAVVGGSCRYITDDDKKCAIGLMIKDEMIENFRDKIVGVFSLFLDVFDNTVLQEKFQGYDVGFYSEIQNLHDYTNYWNEEGLSELGKQRVRVLKEKYAD